MIYNECPHGCNTHVPSRKHDCSSGCTYFAIGDMVIKGEQKNLLSPKKFRMIRPLHLHKLNKHMGSWVWELIEEETDKILRDYASCLEKYYIFNDINYYTKSLEGINIDKK